MISVFWFTIGTTVLLQRIINVRLFYFYICQKFIRFSIYLLKYFVQLQCTWEMFRLSKSILQVFSNRKHFFRFSSQYRLKKPYPIRSTTKAGVKSRSSTILEDASESDRDLVQSVLNRSEEPIDDKIWF